VSKLTIRAVKSLRDSRPLVVAGYELVIVEWGGTPLAVVMADPTESNPTYVGHVRDPEFNDMLAQLGIDKTVIVDDGKKLLLPPGTLPRAEELRL
jgi:hypothetical protein